MKTRDRWLLRGGVALFLGAGVWGLGLYFLWPERDDGSAANAGSETTSGAEEESAAPAELPVMPSRPGAETGARGVSGAAPPPPETVQEPTLVSAHGFRVVGPRPYDPHEPGMVPHPLDEAHQRIATQNALLQSLNDAMAFRRVDEMRELIQEYEKVDPLDVDRHVRGYEAIADCIEFPGEASLGAARAFYATERHSPLRRFVRRICFENRD